jgi:hypothetical protein
MIKISGNFTAIQKIQVQAVVSLTYPRANVEFSTGDFKVKCSGHELCEDGNYRPPCGDFVSDIISQFSV